MKKPATLVINIDDKLGKSLYLKQIKGPALIVISYGLDRREADWRAKDIRNKGRKTSFKVYNKNDLVGEYETKLIGRFNVSNILGAIVAAKKLGIADQAIKRALNRFSGTKRRLEVLGTFSDITIIDDYAHHPTAVKKTIKAVRETFPNRRLVAVFEPHMFTRTKTFLKDFGRSFNEADLSFIADIFPAREKDAGIISSEDLVEEVNKNGANCIYSGNLSTTLEMLKEELKKGDVLLIMGAGTIYKLADQIRTVL